MDKTIKVLSIGNSFSQDAQRYLHDVCALFGKDVQCCNFYIGGCSLERHWNNKLNETPDYGFEINGHGATESDSHVSLQDRIFTEDWDIITLQQVSHLSGKPESFEPYLRELADWLRSLFPKAKLYLQETWAYEIDSTHGQFPLYHCDQQEMYEAVRDTYRQQAASIGAGVIPVGDVIQYLRENADVFNYRRKGLSLNRDGFHLSLDYGRYANALTWYTCLFSSDPKEILTNPGTPNMDPPAEWIEKGIADQYHTEERYLQAIREGVYAVVAEKAMP